eukprot:TRINITY_DN9747_c0_g1_i17.p2 TRINITY_DN9747_c0_g1~~TRINITY_DN9747_c0_g1_i17.p2  ORF type:complete len:148 (-),score=32.38 TRINITY_DN9747_c0_g1_i17:201-644(-)
MIKSAKAPYVVHFLNCPEGLNKESFAEFFKIKPGDVNEVEPIAKTNSVLHTLVSINDQETALKVFAKYTSDNVIPFISHRKLMAKSTCSYTDQSQSIRRIQGRKKSICILRIKAITSLRTQLRSMKNMKRKAMEREDDTGKSEDIRE